MPSGALRRCFRAVEPVWAIYFVLNAAGAPVYVGQARRFSSRRQQHLKRWPGHRVVAVRFAPTKASASALENLYMLSLFLVGSKLENKVRAPRRWVFGQGYVGAAVLPSR